VEAYQKLLSSTHGPGQAAKDGLEQVNQLTGGIETKVAKEKNRNSVLSI